VSSSGIILVTINWLKTLNAEYTDPAISPSRKENRLEEDMP
jgi:hypothetical protein